MSDKYGQSIGGLKTQQKALRERLNELEREVVFLYWYSIFLSSSLLTVIVMRFYG